MGSNGKRNKEKRRCKKNIKCIRNNKRKEKDINRRTILRWIGINDQLETNIKIEGLGKNNLNFKD